MHFHFNSFDYLVSVFELNLWAGLIYFLIKSYKNEKWLTFSYILAIIISGTIPLFITAHLMQ